MTKGAASDSGILENEANALTAAQGYLDLQRESIWVMTCYGPKARLWSYRRGDVSLLPFYPFHGGFGDSDSYVDLLGNEEYLMQAFQHTMANHLPRQSGGEADA